jgi:hypothetical protein
MSPIDFAARSKSGKRKVDPQEAVDAAGPVDAQNAPTGPWITADGYPRAPTAIIRYVRRFRKNVRQPQGGQISVSQGGQISLTNAQVMATHGERYPDLWPR